MRGIHWFRNDLRLRDNRALSALADQAEEWLPVFIIDPEISGGPELHPRARFLRESIARLREDLASRNVPFVLLEGQPEEEIPRLMAKTKASVLSFSEAATPLGRRRDERVRARVESAGGSVISVRDHTVFGPDEIRTKTDGVYSVYTPYRNSWWATWDRDPQATGNRRRMPAKAMPWSERGKKKAFETGRIVGAKSLPTAGEDAALRRLKRFLSGPAEHYHDDRDRPAVEGTSRISPYLRFGAISIRHCFTAGLVAIEENQAAAEGIRKWLDELVWREFYQMVLHHSPHVLHRNYRSQYDSLAWENDDALFDAWRVGQTGYPFIDAGMRQLRETGWMHNRVRMVVASFLTKDLLVDWRRGARYFFDALVDGDPASNNGGWQWAASTGTDAQPYFRIFNPVSQGEKWDPDGEYVRRFVPELVGVPNKHIHSPWKMSNPPANYPAPIVDHAVQREKALSLYRAARNA